MKFCYRCRETYPPDAQFYADGDEDICPACYNDIQDDKRLAAEEADEMARDSRPPMSAQAQQIFDQANAMNLMLYGGGRAKALKGGIE